MLLKILSAWRYTLHIYSFPFELQMANQFIALRKPKREPMSQTGQYGCDLSIRIGKLCLRSLGRSGTLFTAESSSNA